MYEKLLSIITKAHFKDLSAMEAIDLAKAINFIAQKAYDEKKAQETTQATPTIVANEKPAPIVKSKGARK